MSIAELKKLLEQFEDTDDICIMDDGNTYNFELSYFGPKEEGDVVITIK